MYLTVKPIFNFDLFSSQLYSGWQSTTVTRQNGVEMGSQWDLNPCPLLPKEKPY